MRCVFPHPAVDLDDEAGFLRQWQERDRVEKTPFWVLPTNQSLEADDLPAPERHDRLIVEYKLVERRK